MLRKTTPLPTGMNKMQEASTKMVAMEMVSDLKTNPK